MERLKENGRNEARKVKEKKTKKTKKTRKDSSEKLAVALCEADPLSENYRASSMLLVTPF